MEERLTIKQVLMITCDMLRNIGSVPVEESEHIGVPISRAIRNLDECIKVMNESERMAAQEQTAEEPEEEEEEPAGIEEIGGEENG